MEDPHEIQLNKPQYFSPNKNTRSEDWYLWKQEFLIYLELTKAQEKLSEKGLAYLLLNFMGPVGIEAKENMTFGDPNEAENMDILLKKFDEIFDPPINEIEERYKFFSRRKYDAETIENYVTCIKKLAAKCNFGDQTEKFILDMVMLNMDYYLQQHIFAIENLSLPMAIKIYEEYLINEEKMRNICGANFIDIKKANDDFPKNIKEQDSKAESTKDRIDTKEKLVNLLLNNSKENEEKEKTKKMSYTLEKCLWCDLEHPVDQCPHSKNCWGCNNFPHNICFNCRKNPHDDNCSHKKLILPTNDLSKGPVCSKCSTYHLSKADCPAQHVVCKNCFTLGHNTNVCERKGALNTTYQEKVQEKFKQSYNETDDCSWCELQHQPGLCKHNWMCKRCDDFPHNICFNCKNNPHIDICHFKTIITLPAKSASQNNFSQRRGQVCPTCFEAGHSSEECNKIKNNFDRKQSDKRRVDEECKSSSFQYSQPNQGFVNSKQANHSTASTTFRLCPMCNYNCLYNYDEHYDFCNYCQNYVAKKQNQSGAVNVCSKCGTYHQPNQCPTRKKENNTKHVCFRCNTQHPRNQCPAYNVTCSNCHKLGHFNHACKSKRTQNSFSNCPMCHKKTLMHYDNDYDYCKYCKVHITKKSDDSWEEVSSDSSAVQNEDKRRRRRRQRRQPRNRQSNDDDTPCSIS